MCAFAFPIDDRRVGVGSGGRGLGAAVAGGWGQAGGHWGVGEGGGSLTAVLIASNMASNV